MLALQLSLTFTGPTLVLCRFLCYQSRVSELSQAQLSSAVSVGFPIMVLTALLILLLLPGGKGGGNRRKGGRGNEDNYVK